MSLRGFRRALYRTASALGDAQAVASGSPAKIAGRAVRKRATRSVNRSLRRMLP